MRRGEMTKVLAANLEDLYEASKELTLGVTLPVPTPRPRIFHIAPGWTYPYITYDTDDQREKWNSLCDPHGTGALISTADFRDAVATEIGNAVRWRPRAILRAIRRLQAAAAWCRARAAGRQRAVQEILRQQHRAVEALETGEMCRYTMIQVLKAALGDLYTASQELTREGTPLAPTPRPRVFHISPGWTYPYTSSDPWNGLRWDGLRRPDWAIVPIDTAENRGVAAIGIGNTVRWRPRAILRALRGIQTAAAWCRARAAGRKRAAEEIMRQQRRAVEALETELAIRALGR